MSSHAYSIKDVHMLSQRIRGIVVGDLEMAEIVQSHEGISADGLGDVRIRRWGWISPIFVSCIARVIFND